MGLAQSHGQLARISEAKASTALTDAFVEERERLAAQAHDFGGRQLMGAYSDLTDAAIRRIFELSAQQAEVSMPSWSSLRLAVAAVGGYGRREMSPYSDVDIAFIADGFEDGRADELIRQAFRILMEVMDRVNLRAGYSYRTADEVGDLPLDVQTALLDARCVAGSTSLFGEFHSSLKGAIVPAAFVMGHIDARRSAAVSQDTPFVVQPNVKEGPGGLRDLHAARWIAQVAFGLSSEAVWEGLRAKGVILDNEIREIDSSAEFLSRIRNSLHLLAGRGQETLTEGKQALVAEQMGFGGIKEFTSRYYQHAHQLWRIYHKVAEASLQQPLEVEPGIVARDGRLYILDRGLLSRDPAAPIRVFLDAQSYGLRIDHQSADLLTASFEGFDLTPEASRVFLNILVRRGAAAAIRSMADTQALQALVPEFDELMYLVPGDAAHEFTVGEHSLRAVERLEALLGTGEEPFADIASHIQSFETLFLATLLHDIGKLDSESSHTEAGADRAGRVAARLGLPPREVENVKLLVSRHLRMSETARLRDLRQQKTIRDFAAVVQQPQILDMLLLLTVADRQSVSSPILSQAEVRFLCELHQRTAAALSSRGLHGASLESHRTRVKRELYLANLPQDEVDDHCASMPASYLLNAPPDELAAHIGYVRAVRNGTPVVEMKDDHQGQFTELTVVASDRPALLSDIAGALHAMDINVHVAQIYTRHSTDDVAIDILYVDFEGRPLSETRKWQLEGELLEVLNGDLRVEDLLRRVGKDKSSKPQNLRLRTIDGASDHHTVIEIHALDKPGLLHYLTRSISQMGWNIHGARVATWGREARDVFYITGRDQTKLEADEVAAFGAALCGGENGESGVTDESYSGS